MRGPVVVGVDRTSGNLAAVEIAAREAQRHGVELRLVYAVDLPPDHVLPGVPPWDPDGVEQSDLVNRAFRGAERRARQVAPEVTITRDVLIGEPATVLGIEARSASLAVVGSPRRTGLRGLLHASVAGRLCAQGGCRVLVVCGRPAGTGPVVLVDDTSPAAPEAAVFAFAEAAERGADLVILHLNGERSAGELTTLKEKYPEVVVDCRLVRRRPGRALAEASAGARLVVVGAPARGRVPTALCNSVGRSAPRYAHCPVTVIPQRGV